MTGGTTYAEYGHVNSLHGWRMCVEWSIAAVTGFRLGALGLIAASPGSQIEGTALYRGGGSGSILTINFHLSEPSRELFGDASIADSADPLRRLAPPDHLDRRTETPRHTPSMRTESVNLGAHRLLGATPVGDSAGPANAYQG